MAYTPLKMACTQMLRCGLRTWTPCWMTTRSCVLWVVKSFKWPFRWTSSLRLNFYTNTWSTGRNYLHYENALQSLHPPVPLRRVCVCSLYELLVQHRFPVWFLDILKYLVNFGTESFLNLFSKITSNYQIYLTNGPGSLHLQLKKITVVALFLWGPGASEKLDHWIQSWYELERFCFLCRCKILQSLHQLQLADVEWFMWSRVKLGAGLS